MTKGVARLYPGVFDRQAVLTLPEQLRISLYNHFDQNRLYAEYRRYRLESVKILRMTALGIATFFFKKAWE